MKNFLLGILLTTFFAQSAFASSMPDSEIKQKLGIGSGPSLSLDFALDSRSSLGGSFGAPIYRGFFTNGFYDIRFLHKFIASHSFSLSGIVGLTGNPAFNSSFVGSLLGAEAGVGMSFKISNPLTLRLNIVGSCPIDKFGVWNRYGSWNGWFNFVAPSSGLELAYKFTPNLEGTIGGNGQGDFLGINVAF